MTDYTLHQSDFIAANYQDILIDIDIAHENFKKLFPDRDSTWSYAMSNIFSLTAPATNFYQIYKSKSTDSKTYNKHILISKNFLCIKIILKYLFL
jgi:hypothetical protein